ncbi:MAG: ABC transporter substrate-binding protein [Anaerolineae bacterium]|nr:ABC transporter substrate-binding protein [Anaerolineae bacterium]
MFVENLPRVVGNVLHRVLGTVLFIGLLVMLISPAVGQSDQEVEIAVALSLTGEGTSFGQPTLEGIQLAIEEANARGEGPTIKLNVYDDKSGDDEAVVIASQVVASQAALVLGPVFSTISLAAGPIYADAGMVSLPPTATSDLITQNATTFRVVFKNSDQGEMLANYLVRVLGQRQAAVIVVDSSYGITLREGFERTAEKLQIDAQYYTVKTGEDEEEIARQVAADAAGLPIVFLTLDPEGARLLTTLRDLGITGPFLGGDAFGDESFSRLLVDLPGEQAQLGYYTDNLYGLAPVILDSANADTLNFAERFRVQFGHDPVWMAVAGYDAARLAVAAIRATSAQVDLPTRRAAILNYLSSLNNPLQAQPGLLGPFWFDAERARPQAIRIGRFFEGRFESAPIQIVAVTNPDTTEIDSGAVFEVGTGRYARLQRVVYTGMFLNEIPRVDLSRASFNADFYLWLRFAQDAGPDAADPTDLIFPNMISGSFDREHPAEQRQMADGTEYWLWRVQGEFRNDFDLHRFPFDQQALSLPFFNARAPMERIVYVLDKRSNADTVSTAETLSIASPEAFRNLTQWDPLSVQSRRENLVTDSLLGDPSRVGVESQRELSGFLVTVELQRRALATLTKTLLPLLLLTLIMFASLFFPAALVKEKVSVAITGALSGAVLLTAINSQLGSVGYTIAVEYIFYVFFGLCLLCIIAVLSIERLRADNHDTAVILTERLTRIIFLLASVGTLVAIMVLFQP